MSGVKTHFQQPQQSGSMDAQCLTVSPVLFIGQIEILSNSLVFFTLSIAASQSR